MLIINGCVRLGTALFNSKGLFFNRALDKFSECQYNMSFHVQKWPDISNGWSDIPSKKEANKRGGEKTMKGKIGRKERKKKGRKKREKKEKRRSQQNKRRSQQNKRKGRGESRYNEKQKVKERKKSWGQVFKQKEVLCLD